MSGRSLRRLPVLAHARYIGTLPSALARASARPNGPTKSSDYEPRGGGAAVETWLDAMERVVESQATERARLHQ